jgi:hypothetical protein
LEYFLWLYTENPWCEHRQFRVAGQIGYFGYLGTSSVHECIFFLFQRAPFSRFIRVEIDVILVCATNPFPVNIENPESLAKVAIFSARSACMRVHPVVVNVCTQVIFPGRELLYYSVQVASLYAETLLV